MNQGSYTPALNRYFGSRPDLRQTAERLAAAGSAGTFGKYLASAGAAELDAFFDSVARVDFDWLASHRAALRNPAPAACVGLVPLEPEAIDDSERTTLAEIGRRSLAAGEWGVVVFAGGAATRFRSDGSVETPKGLFPLTPVAGRSFLELFAAQILAAGVAAGRLPPFILMTSSVTSPGIREWMKTASLQGFPRDGLIELRQAEHPRLDPDGDIIAGPDGRVVITGDGHGGVFRALLRPDGNVPLAERLREAGIRSLVLHNVDNAAANPLDPARIGLHRSRERLLTLTAVERSNVAEKVGLVCRDSASGRVEVVEYSACPQETAAARDAEGRPLFRLAHINTNLVELDAVRPDLPPTLYRGKVLRTGGRDLATSSLEMLNQHLAGLLEPGRVGVLLLPRSDYFLPTKSLRGEDSLEGTVAALAESGRRLLRSRGALVDDSALVEIDPCVRALDCRDWEIGPAARVHLAVRHGPGSGRPLGRGLKVGRGALFQVESAAPYGRLRFDLKTRVLTEDSATAGTVSIGDGVTVPDGARVILSVAAGSTLSEPPGAVLSSRP